MPGKATESDILAWIEGDLPPDRARAVEGAFDADPSLRAWAEAMRLDRSALRAWSQRARATAPGGLAEGALERVERDALLGPSEIETDEATQQEDAPVIGVIHRVRRWAVAAAILLVAGVIALVGVELGPAPWIGGSMEVDVATAPSDPVMTERQAEVGPGADLLDAVTSKGAPAPNGHNAEQHDLETTVASADTMRRSAMIEEDTIRARPLSENRDLSEMVRRLLGEAAGGGSGVQITPEQAARAEATDRVVVLASAPDPHAVAIAMQQRASDPASVASGWHIISDGSDQSIGVDGVVISVSVPGEAPGFTWLLSALREAGATDARLTLRDGEPASGDGSAPLDAARALWWGEPMESWAPWTRVAVLIKPAGAAQSPE